MDFPRGSTSSEFIYNDFGAMTADPSRGITDITYDNFGNPTRIQFDSRQYIINVYSANGEKLKTTSYYLLQQNSVVPDVAELGLMTSESVEAGDLTTIKYGISTTQYHGPVIYRNGTVEMLLFPGGYATINGAAVTFHYYTQDYLGNNRAVINGSTGAIEQTVAYYPYGGVIANLGFNQTSGQPYKFGGKELMTANGLNEYDFGARQYYSAVPGFTKPDPYGEGFPHLSPYLFCGNDPVNKVDPSGMVFTEASQKYIDKFMSNIESRIQANNNNIAKKKAELSKSGLSNKKANKIQRGIAKLEGSNASLEVVKSEIATLQESTQVYNIYRDDSMNVSGDPIGFGGMVVSGVKFNEQTNMFDIMLGDDSLGMLAHELKHAYQFETGDFSSGMLKNGEPFYDLTDEIEAYERGYMFGQPRNKIIAQQYEYLQRSPSGVRSLIDAIKNDPDQLQKYAERSHSTFRWRGSTYKHKR